MSLHPRRKDISKNRFHLTCFVGQNVENACQVPRRHRGLGHQNTVPEGACSEFVLRSFTCTRMSLFLSSYWREWGTGGFTPRHEGGFGWFSGSLRALLSIWVERSGHECARPHFLG